MKTFRLIGNTTVFKVVSHSTYIGIECVTGHTLVGRKQTTARVADIAWLT